MGNENYWIVKDSSLASDSSSRLNGSTRTKMKNSGYEQVSDWPKGSQGEEEMQF